MEIIEVVGERHFTITLPESELKVICAGLAAPYEYLNELYHEMGYIEDMPREDISIYAKITRALHGWD